MVTRVTQLVNRDARQHGESDERQDDYGAEQRATVMAYVSSLLN
jgi:hypothetical protein